MNSPHSPFISLSQQMQNNIKLNPTHRLKVLQHTIHRQQSIVDSLRYRGRLQLRSKALEELLQIRLRQAVLARLSTEVDFSGESMAHFEIARCYKCLELWSHTLKHTKKALELARASSHSSSPTSQYHHCRILVLMGEAIAHSTDRAGSHLSTSIASAYRVLERAAKLVKLNINEKPQETSEINENEYGDDFENDDDDHQPESQTHSLGSLTIISKHITKAELCEAMATVCGLAAVEADNSLHLRARKSAEEWLVGKEGQQRMQERTNELTNRYLEHKTTQENSNNGNGKSGWKKSTNAATMRHEAEGRSRSQLLKEASADVCEQLIEQGEATSERYHKNAVDWLTRGWEYREAAFGRHHPETVLAYERLGRAHFIMAGKSKLAKDKVIENMQKNGIGNSGRGEDTPAEHARQAVSLLETSLRLSVEMRSTMGVGSATHARISRSLSKAYEIVERFEDAGLHALTVASYYESEANRGIRCLVKPETGVPGNGNDADNNDDEYLPIVVEQTGNKTPVILPASVGVFAAAEKSRMFYRQSIRYYVAALRAIEKKGDDVDAEIRVGTDCIAALKHSVRVSATFFGTGSIEAAQDLFSLGKLCSTYSWDMNLALKSLNQSKNLFLKHGKTKQADKVHSTLRSHRAMISNNNDDFDKQ
jgi:hypothetical protein